MIHNKISLTIAAALSMGASAAAHAGPYTNTLTVFKDAGQSANFFSHSYGYAVFPTIGQGGLVIGGAHGDGRLYVHGKRTGNVEMSQVSVGLQAGGKAYSQIIFFEDKRALDEFKSGSFQFGADASVVAITAAAGANAGTTGAEAGASVDKRDATTAGRYQNGMVVFTVAKGGAMFDATVVGQKYSYKSRRLLASS